MATFPSCFRRWSVKQYILAALIGAQVAIAISVVVSIVLSPAHINLYIANAKTVSAGDDELFYNFTLVSSNPSRRTEVKYGAIRFDIWYSETGWSPAEKDPPPAEAAKWLPRGTTDIANMKIPYWQYDVRNYNKSQPPAVRYSTVAANANGSVVVVTAQAWFRVGKAVTTRPYIIKVNCQPVDFSFRNDSSNSKLVNCTA